MVDVTLAKSSALYGYRSGVVGSDQILTKGKVMKQNEKTDDDRESAKSHRASIEIADALANMFAELKPKIMAKYSLEDEQIILLAIAKAAVKLGSNSMQAGTLSADQSEKLERKLQNIMLNAFMFGEIDD